MEKLEKVEVIREKCGVSYEDAKAALDACDDNVLDAIIWLEKQGKSTKQTANYTTESFAQSDVSPEMEAAQIAYQESSKKSDFSENMSSLWEKCKELFNKSVETKFIVTFWLLIIGLFFEMRYHIQGAYPIVVDVNEAMDKAADAAGSIKKDVIDKK